MMTRSPAVGQCVDHTSKVQELMLEKSNIQRDMDDSETKRLRLEHLMEALEVKNTNVVIIGTGFHERPAQMLEGRSQEFA